MSNILKLFADITRDFVLAAETEIRDFLFIYLYGVTRKWRAHNSFCSSILFVFSLFVSFFKASDNQSFVLLNLFSYLILAIYSTISAYSLFHDEFIDNKLVFNSSLNFLKNRISINRYFQEL